MNAPQPAPEGKGIPITTLIFWLGIGFIGVFLVMALLLWAAHGFIVNLFNLAIKNLGLLGVGLMALALFLIAVIAVLAYIVMLLMKRKQDPWAVFVEWCKNSPSASRYGIDYSRVDWAQSDKYQDSEKNLLAVCPYLDDSEHPGKFWTFVIDMSSKLTMKEFHSAPSGDVIERNKQLMKLLETGETLEKKLDVYEEMKRAFYEKTQGGQPQVTSPPPEL